jgi:copper oxidase (laccase) domain-containing protein
MKIYDVFGGITNIIRGKGLTPRIGPIREPYSHGDLIQQAILRWIAETVQPAGAEVVLAPDPIKCNGRIIEANDPEFAEPIPIAGSTVKFIRGINAAYADGIVLPPGSAFWMISADCCLINVVDIESGKVIAAHGPRDALLGGLIPAIMGKFLDSKREDLWVMASASIQPDNFSHPWNHPEFREQNRQMTERIWAHWPQAIVGELSQGKVWLQMLAALQFMDLGIPTKNIFFDKMDTYSERRETGELAYYSFRRDRIEREEREKQGWWAPIEVDPRQRQRNAIISVHRGGFSRRWDWCTVPGIYPVTAVLKTT